MHEQNRRPSPIIEEPIETVIQPEGLLRGIARERIEKIDIAALAPLLTRYATFGFPSTAEDLQQHFIAGIDTAQRALSWGVRNNHINMGFYANTESFFTILLHETGHRNLIKLGRPDEEYTKDPLTEELFCWETAEQAAHILNLPFSKEQATIDASQAAVLIKIRSTYDPKLYAKLDELISEERHIKGFSLWDRHTVSWTEDGVPQLIAERAA